MGQALIDRVAVERPQRAGHVWPATSVDGPAGFRPLDEPIDRSCDRDAVGAVRGGKVVSLTSAQERGPPRSGVLL
jgi:hypothetical protein